MLVLEKFYEITWNNFSNSFTDHLFQSLDSLTQYIFSALAKGGHGKNADHGGYGGYGGQGAHGGQGSHGRHGGQMNDSKAMKEAMKLAKTKGNEIKFVS